MHIDFTDGRTTTSFGLPKLTRTADVPCLKNRRLTPGGGCIASRLSFLANPKPKNRKDIVMENTPTPPPVVAGEDKTVAIVAYLTLIGFLVAVIIHSSKKTRLGAYHLRQMLGFMLSMFAVIILMFIPIIGWILIPVFYLFMLVCWIMGLVSAINGQMKPMPVVGPMYQKWFGTTFD
jgi:uncharacterized membrane protein